MSVDAILARFKVNKEVITDSCITEYSERSIGPYVHINSSGWMCRESVKRQKELTSKLKKNNIKYKLNKIKQIYLTLSGALYLSSTQL